MAETSFQINRGRMMKEDAAVWMSCDLKKSEIPPGGPQGIEACIKIIGIGRVSSVWRASFTLEEAGKSLPSHGQGENNLRATPGKFDSFSDGRWSFELLRSQSEQTGQSSRWIRQQGPSGNHPSGAQRSDVLTSIGGCRGCDATAVTLAGELQVVGYRLWVTGCGLQVVGYRLWVTGW